MDGDFRSDIAAVRAASIWNLIEEVATGRGLSAGELIRYGALAAAEYRPGHPSGAIPEDLGALIKASYRGIYILSTLKRDEMNQEGRGEEMDTMVQKARDAQASILDGGPG